MMSEISNNIFLGKLIIKIQYNYEKYMKCIYIQMITYHIMLL